MSLVQKIKEVSAKAIEETFNHKVNITEIQVNSIKLEVEGDYAVILFPFAKLLKQSPNQLGETIGNYLKRNNPDLIEGYKIVNGYLNLNISNVYYIQFLKENHSKEEVATFDRTNKKIVLEYSSPNTNKPLHLGHLRNNFLGWSVSKILEKVGNEVVKTCVVNDRGIHICKSMIAWQLFGNGSTPASTGKKGDHFVGDYYVKFNEVLKNQIKAIGLIAFEIHKRVSYNRSYESLEHYSKILNLALEYFTEIHEHILSWNLPIYSIYHLSIYSKRYKEIFKEYYPSSLDITDSSEIINFDKEILQKAFAKKSTEQQFLILAKQLESRTPMMKQAQRMLLDWENGVPEVIELWKKMNSWVYEGFESTYKRIGINFEKTYFESKTYLLGKQFVESGLAKGVFVRKKDGSVWVDLTDDKLDEKLVLRKDGTSVYITQDLGLAQLKYEDYHYDQSIYVIADEQDYHIKVLKLILKKLNMPYAGGIFHLSYGMVELPSGRMKSREGTVVDADDLVDEMIVEANKKTKEHSKIEDFTVEELKELYDIVGLGALKFYLLRVDPKKKMVFNPEESIEFHGFTGPFVQYTYARLKSILRRSEERIFYTEISHETLFKLEKDLLVLLEQYRNILKEAASEYNPATIANYIYSVAKSCNSFYTEHKVLRAENEEKKQLRVQLCELTANTIKDAMSLLGIKVPERM